MFQKRHNVCFNEGILLCSQSQTDKLSSGELAEVLGLTTSSTSKVIESVEAKELVELVLGSADKWQMCFFLSKKGKRVLPEIKYNHLEIPDLLQEMLQK